MLVEVSWRMQVGVCHGTREREAAAAVMVLRNSGWSVCRLTTGWIMDGRVRGDVQLGTSPAG